ncbi:MAGI3 [Cordylochernes scorpioides]|uniref:MAGI3 n=1 Tax=Cordylochernes scorpioides TaxID=51811 RepID=A0ABY6KYW0_9ARAC|nr:MAGI3 [Cordylochernes scorpioides]
MLQWPPILAKVQPHQRVQVAKRGSGTFRPVAAEQHHAVELHRGARGFGFSIRGGREFGNMPLYVLKIAEGGPAYLNSNIHVGDEILEINGHSTANMSHQEAIQLIRQSEHTVQLVLRPQN